MKWFFYTHPDHAEFAEGWAEACGEDYELIISEENPRGQVFRVGDDPKDPFGLDDLA